MPREVTINDSVLDICDSPPFSPHSLPSEIPRTEAEMDASGHGDECPGTSNFPCEVMASSIATHRRARDTSDLEDEGGLREEPAAVRRCDQRKDAAETKGKAKAKAHSGAAQHPRLTELNPNVNPVFPGTTAGNLLIPPLGTTSKTIRYYLPCPISRRLDWRTPHAPTPATADGKRWVGDTADPEAAFVQTRGLIAKRSCAGCSAGRGLWKSCVERLGKKNNGICANCWQAGEFCPNFNMAPSPGEMASTLRPHARLDPHEQLTPFPLLDEKFPSHPLLRRAVQVFMERVERVKALIAELEKKQKRDAAEERCSRREMQRQRPWQR
ncbi:hypothetical protein BDV10DRAFT_190268 [Aspergillus recurvatus]